jgi:hypothetical protein
MTVTHYQNGQGNNDSVINILINIIITDIHTIICGKSYMIKLYTWKDPCLLTWTADFEHLISINFLMEVVQLKW